MKRFILVFSIMAIFVLLASAQSKSLISQCDYPCQKALRTEKVINALKVMKERYPEARYRDVYKNFMQDYYGPGHILADTAASGEYLRYELQNAERFDGDLYEPTGYNGNFYRVNISLIEDGTLSYDDYFSAFVRSARKVVPPSIKEWRKEWEAIDKIMQSEGFVYDDDASDREMIFSQLEEGDPVVHHSDHFNSVYSVHYRIISTDIFNKEILPKVRKKIQKIENSL